MASHPRLERLGLVLVPTIVLAAFWSWQTWELRAFYGQDAGIYTIMGARFANGDQSMLWTAYTGPALPFLLGATTWAGLGVTAAYHAVALLGYVTLVVAIGVFFHAVAKTMASPPRVARAAALLGAMLFGLAPDVLNFGAQPVTDLLTLACLLVALAVLPRLGASRVVALVLGISCTMAYFVRYATLGPVVIVEVAALAVLVTLSRRGNLGRAEALTRGALVVGPLVLCVGMATLRLSGAEYGVSYGANTQSAANVVVAVELDEHPVSDVHRVLNSDGTFGFYHADPAMPDAWNLGRWLGQRTFIERADLGARLRQRLIHPGHSFRQIVRAVNAAARTHGTIPVVVGLICWLALLARANSSRAMLWAASAIVGMTLAGGLVLYFGETRYLWFPIVVALAGLAPGTWLAWNAAREQCPSTKRTLARMSTLICAFSLAVWALNPLLGGNMGVVGALLSQHRGQQNEMNVGLAHLLEPARKEVELETGRPFSAATIASRNVGQAIGVRARWIPLAVPPVSEAVWAHATVEERRGWMFAMIAYFRRGRVRYVVVVEDDFQYRPASRPFFAADLSELPPDMRLLGAVGRAEGGRPLARVFEIGSAP